MTEVPMFHDGMRYYQDRFETRQLADRLEQVLHYTAFKDEHRTFIESSPFFFLATTDADGWPDCSYKGGLPGFVRLVDEQTLAFPSYDGNGMFRSLGNIRTNPRVGMLFMDFERPQRLRINGTAIVSEDDALMGEFPGAQLMVRVHAEHVFPNCPRHIHKMDFVEHSKYSPRLDYEPPVPGWKRMPELKDALPPGDPARDVDSD